MELNESFERLEEKVSKAGEAFKRALAEKREMELSIEQLKESSKDSDKRVDLLQREVQSLRKEREEVRARVEKLLGQIDQLTSANGAD